MNQEAYNGLQVGFGRESITPEGVVHLAGGDAARRRSTVLLDELFITCVALHQQDMTLLLYTMDLICAEHSFTAPAKAAISQATGVPEVSILMNATHTHASVSIRSQWDGVEAYRDLFNTAAVRAGVCALADLAAAEASWGSTQTENMAFVRHYVLSDGSYAGANFGNFKAGTVVGHAEKADGELQVVRFAREGKKDVVLMNFPAHATMSGTCADTEISADFPSPTRQYIEENSDSLVAYFIAAAGNQVPSSRIAGESPFQKKDHRSYGQTLGKYAITAMENLAKVSGTGLKLSAKTFTGHANKEKLHLLPKVEVVVEAGKQYGNLNAATVKIARENGFSSYFEATAVQRRSTVPDTCDMELRVMSIGDLGFIFAPYEMFGTQGMYIKAHSPFPATFIISCSEGAMGYLPSKKGVEIGCYESCVTKFQPGTAEQLAEEFVAMLTEIK